MKAGESIVISSTNRAALLRRLAVLFVVAGLCACGCARKKEAAATGKQAPAHDLTGEWQSEIQGADRVITKSLFRIEQKADSVSLELTSTKSPAGEELVPRSMRLDGSGAWTDGALRLALTSWVSGKDTCFFLVNGEMDAAGNLLLHFPGDLCGDKSLPYTRTLARIDTTTAQ
jgi:hypothetical protein